MNRNQQNDSRGFFTFEELAKVKQQSFINKGY